MSFDLTTATPLYEDTNKKKTVSFDLSTAMPVSSRFSFDDYNNLDNADIEKIDTISKMDVFVKGVSLSLEPFAKGLERMFRMPENFKPKESISRISNKEYITQRKEHPIISRLGEFTGGILPFVATAPIIPEELLGSFSLPFLFGSIGGISEAGRQEITGEKDTGKIVSKTVEESIFGSLFGYASRYKYIGGPIETALKRAGAIGTARIAVSTIFGENLALAFKEGGYMFALTLLTEVPPLAKTLLGRQIIKEAGKKVEDSLRASGYSEDYIRANKVTIDVDKLDEVSRSKSIGKLIKLFDKVIGNRNTEKVNTEYSTKANKTKENIISKELDKKIDNMVDIYNKNISNKKEEINVKPIIKLEKAKEEERITANEEEDRLKKLQEIKKETDKLKTEELEALIDKRYEEGATQQELDTLEDIYAERISEESQGFMKELESDEIDYQPSTEELLVRAYSQIKELEDSGKERLDNGMTLDDIIANMRSNIELAFGEDLSVIPDDEFIKAAKDLYNAREELLSRRRFKEPREGIYKANIPVLEKELRETSILLEQEEEKLDNVRKLRKVIVGNITRDAEKDLFRPPEIIFSKGGVSTGIDEIADEYSNELISLGYEPTEEGIREFISDYIGYKNERGKNSIKDIKNKISEMKARLKDVKKKLKEELKSVSVKKEKDLILSTDEWKKKINKLAAIKGFSKKSISSIIFSKTGRKSLTKDLSIDELKDIYNSIKKRRPKRVKNTKVITKKTERHIYALKKTLEARGELNDAYFKQMLSVLKIKEPFYRDAKHFTPEDKGKELLSMMHSFAPIAKNEIDKTKVRLISPLLADEIEKIDKFFEAKYYGKLADPNPFQDFPYYIDEIEQQTGLPVGKLHQDMMKDKHKAIRLNEKEIVEPFNKIASKFKKGISKELQQKLEDYLASDLPKEYYENVPEKPKDMTKDEIELAEFIKKTLEKQKEKIKFERTLRWIEIGDSEELKGVSRADFNKAKDIYDTEGVEGLEKFLKDKDWGIIRKGHTPIEVISKMHLQKRYKVTKGIKGLISRGKSFVVSDRDFLSRYFSYMRRVYIRYYTSKRVRAFETIFKYNADLFKDRNNVQQNLKRHLIDFLQVRDAPNFPVKVVMKVYAQTARALYNMSPKAVRNLFQNLAFYPFPEDAVYFKPIEGDTYEYFYTNVSNLRQIQKDLLFILEKTNIPVLKQLNNLADTVNFMGRTDEVNRYALFSTLYNKAISILEGNKDAFSSRDNFNKLTKDLRFSLLDPSEQSRLFQEGAINGEEAFAREYARYITEKIHFRYARELRPPVEQGDYGGDIITNLTVFYRSYLQGIARNIYKLSHNEGIKSNKDVLRILTHQLIGAFFAGMLLRKILGTNFNSYNPKKLLTSIIEYTTGGLMMNAMANVTSAMRTLINAVSGDEKAQKELPRKLVKINDTMIPFYKMFFDAIEGMADKKDIDVKFYADIFKKAGMETPTITTEKHRNTDWKIKKILFGSEQTKEQELEQSYKEAVR